MKDSRPGDREDDDPRPAAAWRGVRSQISIILGIGTCVIALLWLIMVDVIQRERTAAIEDSRGDVNNLSAAFQGEISQNLNSVARGMEAVAERMRAAPGQFDIHEWATEIRLVATTPIDGTILGPDGKLLTSTSFAHPPPLDLSDREYFRVHLDGTFKGLYVSKPVRGRLSGQIAIRVSQRVTAADGTFLGVVVFALAPGQLTVLHNSIDLGPGGMMAVVGTDDGIIRARFSKGNETGDFGVGEQIPPLPPAVEDEGSAQTYIRESVVDHVTRLFGVRQIPDFQLRVTVGVDLTRVLASAVAHARLIGAIGVIATLMLVGLMALLVVEIRRRDDREVKLRIEQTRLAAEIRQGAQVQEWLRSSEARLRDYAEMASDWFWEQDAEFRFVETSVEGPARSGADRVLFGKHPWEVFDTNLAPEKWENHKRDLLAHKPFRDFRHTRPGDDGKLRHVSINGVPVFGEAGVFLGYRGTGRDITAEVEAAEALRRSTAQAEASSMAKSAFLANMSHELRTPLNAIIGFSELLHARTSGPITAEYVLWSGDILASGLHLLDLINDVLELSRIEAGRYDLVDDSVDLGAAIGSCVSMVRGLAEKNRVRIDCAVAPREVTLRADRRAIKQVLLNLLTNAVKFTPRDGLVTIGVAPAPNGELSLFVADTGIGIDPEALPKLGKPFIQADASTSRRYGGTGLGLAISSRLVDLHGGRLSIASTLGRGTTVLVTFPGARVLSTQPQPVAAE